MRIEVTAPPVKFVDRELVEFDHRIDRFRRDIAAAQSRDANAPAVHFLAFAPDLGALLGGERGEEIFERAVTLVVPLVLQAEAQGVPGATENFGLLFEQEEHVRRGHRLSIEHAPYPFGDREDHALALSLVGDEHAGAGGWGKRHCQKQLRVVPDPELVSELRPTPIENEFAFTVSLHVGRSRGDEALAFPQRHMKRQPPAVGYNATRTLEGVEKRKGEKWGCTRPQKPIPLRAGNVANALVDPQLDHQAILARLP
jgi:hypothetical protein